MIDNFIWAEKYRPRKIEDCILPPDLKQYFMNIVEGSEVPNMLFYGSAGSGKTTVARALCDEMGIDYLFINGSEESGIDVLRTRIRDYASTKSFNDKIKVVVIDEAEYLNPNSFQPAFRGFIEEFSTNCRFILTCNNRAKIIAPLHSRLTSVDFKLGKDDKSKIAKLFYKRVIDILGFENVKFDNTALAEVIKKYFPDFRKTLVELQRNCSSGELSLAILKSSDVNIDELRKILREKDWNVMRKWVADNISIHDSNEIFRLMFDSLIDHTKNQPHLVSIIADYSYKSAFVLDQEINMVAFLTEVMANVNFE